VSARSVRWAALSAAISVAIALLLAGCGRARGTAPVTLRLWAMGREGEVVQELVRDFEREHHELRVEVQQMPWTAAHEKLITAVVGGSTPDVAQLGNTWVPEFAALHALTPLDDDVARSSALAESSYFRGIWDTNVIEGRLYGVPWYVDTRVLFYRTDVLARAGYDSIPGSWAGWRDAMEAVCRVQGPGKFALFLPTNEYTPWIVFGLQAHSPMLLDHGTRGAFSQPEFRHAMEFALDLFRRGLAPAVQGAQISNRYQEFERGLFSMYISGPWDVGEFSRRLSPAMKNRWFIAALPGPEGPASGVSTAGGSSLVIFRSSRHPAEAWKLIEFLSRPEQQLRFYQLCGNLPARTEAWRDTLLSHDRFAHVFETQLRRVVPSPKVPEWESISLRIQDAAEAMVLAHANTDSTLAALDRDVARDLEKRRWLLAHGRLALQTQERP
jgi:multiple sugar transport system substrate-binding protein